MQHEATREKVQQEKSAAHKKVQHGKGTVQKNANMKRDQYENSVTPKKCNTKSV